jgi:hypothetical protein
MVGIGAPNRNPGNEGWARFGTLRNCTFNEEVQGISSFATAEGCKFIASTIRDPVVTTSQEDDILDSIDSFDTTGSSTEILLRLRSNTFFRDCKFYGGRIHLDADADGSLLDNCEFHLGTLFQTGNAFQGTVTLRDCHNVRIDSSYPTVNATKVINVYEPTGSYSVDYNGAVGGNNDITVNKYSSEVS